MRRSPQPRRGRRSWRRRRRGRHTSSAGILRPCLPASFATPRRRAVVPVEGWMTDAQARRLWDSASRGRPRAAGSSRSAASRGGRRSCSRSAAADGVEVVAIDPHAGNDRGPQEFERLRGRGGPGDHEVFLANLAAAGVADRVRHVRAFSPAALGAGRGRVDLLYIDGAHRYGPALDDIRRGATGCGPAGRCSSTTRCSSIGVTLAILRQLLLGRRFRYVGRSGSLAEYRRVAGASSRQRRPSAGAAALVRAQRRAKILKGPWPY